MELKKIQKQKWQIGVTQLESESDNKNWAQMSVKMDRETNFDNTSASREGNTMSQSQSR